MEVEAVMDKTSFSVSKNYGHMEVRLKEYLDRRNITRYALANAANVRFEVIDRWYKGKIDRIDRVFWREFVCSALRGRGYIGVYTA